MGTNYYLLRNPCEHCGRSDERLHIGKSSAGWCFALHVMPEENINSLEDWQVEFGRPSRILDEYGADITILDLMWTITERKWARKTEPFGYRDWKEFHEQNDSVEGPNGLVRHKIGRHCVGHGSGTWDLIPGEFS